MDTYTDISATKGLNMKFSILNINKVFITKQLPILATFLITLSISINSSTAQMFMHDLKHTGRSSYQVTNSNEAKWDLITGGEIWSSPVIGTDNTIYVASTDGNFYALNPDGTEKWYYKTGDELYGTPAIGEDGTIYVGGKNKNF